MRCRRGRKKIRRRARNALSRRRPVSNWILKFQLLGETAMAVPRRYDVRNRQSSPLNLRAAFGSFSLSACFASGFFRTCCGGLPMSAVGGEQTYISRARRSPPDPKRTLRADLRRTFCLNHHHYSGRSMVGTTNRL
jgi:hypothetical protein